MSRQVLALAALLGVPPAVVDELTAAEREVISRIPITQLALVAAVIHRGVSAEIRAEAA